MAKKQKDIFKLLAEWIEEGLYQGGYLNDWDEQYYYLYEDRGERYAMKIAKELDRIVDFTNEFRSKKKQIKPTFVEEAKEYAIEMRERHEEDKKNGTRKTNNERNKLHYLLKWRMCNGRT